MFLQFPIVLFLYASVDFNYSTLLLFLTDLQNEFDDNVAKGSIGQKAWYDNATEGGILAFRLLAQTGNVDDPHDVNQV